MYVMSPSSESFFTYIFSWIWCILFSSFVCHICLIKFKSSFCMNMYRYKHVYMHDVEVMTFLWNSIAQVHSSRDTTQVSSGEISRTITKDDVISHVVNTRASGTMVTSAVHTSLFKLKKSRVISKHWFNWLVPTHCFFIYIMAVSFIGGGNRRTQRKPLICHKSLTNLIT